MGYFVIWITIILDIIQAAPTIINLLVEIWDAIHGQPVQQRAFRELLLKHADLRSTPAGEFGAAQTACVSDFQAFRDGLKG